MKISFKNKGLARTLEPASQNYWGCQPQLLEPERSLEPALCNKRSNHNEKPEPCSESKPTHSDADLAVVVVQSLSRVRLFATPWTAARQASLCFTNSQSLLKLMSIESVMPSNHLILCHPLLLLSSVFPSIRVFSKESACHIWWPKYWSFSISLSNEYSDWFPLGWTGWISLQSKGLTRIF